MLKEGIKVKIVRDNETVMGFVTKVFEPNDCHSGRFIVHIHERNYEHDAEFWYSDFGKSVIEVKK